jgi:hypothetical protein
VSHELDPTRIEECISQAKQQREKYMAEVWGSSLKKAIGALFLLLAAMLPSLKDGSGS